MVIHDLRNPTNQVEYLVNQSLGKLKEIQQKYHQIKKLQENESCYQFSNNHSEQHLKKLKDSYRRGSSFNAKHD